MFRQRFPKVCERSVRQEHSLGRVFLCQWRLPFQHRPRAFRLGRHVYPRNRSRTKQLGLCKSFDKCYQVLRDLQCCLPFCCCCDVEVFFFFFFFFFFFVLGFFFFFFFFFFLMII